MDLGLKDKVVVCMSSASGFGKGIATEFAREGAKVVICTSEAFKAELDQAVVAARKRFPKLAVEVEVESLRECASALKARPEWIMLDNMSCADMKKCVKLCKGISKTEASGGITLDRAKAVAATGVTAISLGCLTHSQGSIDLTLEWKAV